MRECSKQLVCTSWLIATLLFSTLACAAPSITLSQKTGPPTSQILISGSGFNANVQVDIYFDADDEAQVVTDTAGSFDSAKIHALQTALPGQHWVSALDLKDHLGARTKFLVETSWTQLHFGGGGNRLNLYENVVNRMNVHSLTVKWKYKMLGHINSAASVVDGVLYVGAPDGKLEAIDAETGTELWNFGTGGNGPVDTVPAVANGVVYVSNIGARTGELYALNAKTGALLWTAPYGSSYSSPAVANGIVYVGSNDDSIYAIDAKTGQLVWSNATFSTVYSSPSVVDGVVYVGSDDYGVYAFDAKTGDLLWRFATYGDISGSPAIVSGALYVTSWDGYLYAVNIRTGEQLWKFYGSNCCDESSPVVIDGTVYFGGAGGSIYALDAKTGTQVWSAPFDYVSSSLAAANGIVYVNSWDNNVHALDAHTGNQLWNFTTGGPLEGSPTIVNGVLYAGSDDGRFYAFSLSRTVGSISNRQ